MSPRNLFNRPEVLNRTRSVIYPMQVSNSGSFLAKSAAHRSNIHFLLDFLRGAAFWRPEYGVDLARLEQAGAELDTLLPVVAWQLRQNLEEFVPRIALDGILVTRELQQRRALRFDVVYRQLTSNRRFHEAIDDNLIQQAVQPNRVLRDNFIAAALAIPWESAPAPAVDPYLSMARASQDKSGWISWGATETMKVAPLGTNSALTFPAAVGAIPVGYGGISRSGYGRQYPGTLHFATRQPGGWGLYYRALVMIDSTNVEYMQEAQWGLANWQAPSGGNFAYFSVTGAGSPGSRVPSNLKAVIQDGESSGESTQIVDLGMSAVDVPRLIEIVIIPGAIKFFVDGVEELNNTFVLPPTTKAGNSFTAEHVIFGDDPPGGGGANFPTGFFTPNDGLRYERIQGGGACAIKALEQRFGFFDYPDDPA